jgi:hypothetical protein
MLEDAHEFEYLYLVYNTWDREKWTDAVIKSRSGGFGYDYETLFATTSIVREFAENVFPNDKAIFVL